MNPFRSILNWIHQLNEPAFRPPQTLADVSLEILLILAQTVRTTAPGRVIRMTLERAGYPHDVASFYQSMAALEDQGLLSGRLSDEDELHGFRARYYTATKEGEDYVQFAFSVLDQIRTYLQED
jgi:DNA-binding PadR family transcriptional regulator